MRHDRVSLRPGSGNKNVVIYGLRDRAPGCASPPPPGQGNADGNSVAVLSSLMNSNRMSRIFMVEYFHEVREGKVKRTQLDQHDEARPSYADFIVQQIYRIVRQPLDRRIARLKTNHARDRSCRNSHEFRNRAAVEL